MDLGGSEKALIASANLSGSGDSEVSGAWPLLGQGTANSAEKTPLRLIASIVALARSVREHLSDPQSSHRQIAVGFLSVSFFVFIGKFAGAAKEMVVAWRYGVGETIDAYVFVFNMVNWPIAVWFNVMSTVLIPLFVRLRAEDAVGLRVFRAELYGVTALAGAALAALVGALLSWTPFLAEASGLAPGATRIAHEIVWPLALCIPLALPISVLACETMAQRRHGNTLLEGVPALTLCFAVLLMGAWPAAALSYGTLAGFCAQFGIMLWYLSCFDSIPRLRIGFSAFAWRPFRGVIATIVVAQIVNTLAAVIDPFWGARLGEGVIAAMSYANRMLALLVGMGALAIGRAMLPVLSGLECGDGPQRYRLSRLWASGLFALGAVCAAVIWISAPLLVRLVFERGAFIAADTARVTEFLRWGLLQLPFYFGSLVWASQLNAARAYQLLFFGALGNLCVKVGGNEVASRLIGADGLYLATACMYCFSFIFYWFGARRMTER